MMEIHREVVNVLTVWCENDDCFSWFHFVNSYFICGCFEDKLRLTHYTKGKAGSTSFWVDETVFWEFFKAGKGYTSK